MYKKLISAVFVFAILLITHSHDALSASKNKFLVTGGCGFIGSHLVDSLIDSGHEVIVLDDLSTGKMENLNSKATLIKGNITNKKLLEKIFTQHKDLSGCFHLAAIASVLRSNQEWLDTHHVNISGTITLFEQASKYKVPVVYASSASVYGEREGIKQESDLPSPQTAYAADKYSCELHANVAHVVHKLPTIGLRFFNVYGPRQDTSPYSGVIAIFSKKLAESQPIQIDGDGAQTRDFIYVKDVAAALTVGMERLLEGNDVCEIYNVCTGKGASILDLTSIFEGALDHKVSRVFRKKRSGDITKLVGSPQKFYRTFDLKPKTSLGEGIKMTLAYYKGLKGKS